MNKYDIMGLMTWKLASSMRSPMSDETVKSLERQKSETELKLSKRDAELRATQEHVHELKVRSSVLSMKISEIVHRIH